MYNLECLVPTVKYGGGSVMAWAAIFWYSVGPIITLRGQITAREYMYRLGNQVNPIIQTLYPNNDAVFQEDNASVHTSWNCLVMV
jgi:hypothetical protein